MLLTYIFWIGLIVIFYTYVGYGILISLLVSVKRRSHPKTTNAPDDLPGVTLVIAAYNEEKFIQEKLKDTLSLDYPREKLTIFFVTDGSGDSTPEIIKNYPQFHLFHQPERKGKIHAVNRVMKFVTSPITVFCDANTYLNKSAIRNLVRHFSNPAIGGVAGEKRILKAESDNASASGEGLYWKYESFLKKKDAELSTVVGAAGELYAIRTSLFEPPAESMIIEDFYLSLRMVAKGFRFAYEPEAYAMETASATVSEEWKRKVRICAGAFQAMPKLAILLNPFRYGVVSLQYFSHRVLRWTIAPLFLPLLFVSNLLLAWDGPIFFQLMLTLQTAFYLLAGLGFLFREQKVSFKGFFIPYYFVVMNGAVYAGFLRHVKGGQSVTWDRAERAELDLK
jgi:poly-beta-1,6-N-acetyl-D-glucosamine synthase